MGILFAIFFILTLGLILTHALWDKFTGFPKWAFLIGMGLSFALTLAFGILFAQTKYFANEKQ